jgi:hypothetical protein
MEKENLKIYIDLPSEIEELFAENLISISQLLRDNNVEEIKDITTVAAPYKQEDGSTSKDAVTLIIAGSVALTSITFAITSIINILYKKPYFVEYDELVELRDKDGNIIFDKEKKPIFKAVKKYELVEPRKENKKSEILSIFNPLKGVVLKVKNEKRELENSEEKNEDKSDNTVKK